MADDVTIIGLDELDRRMKALPGKVVKKIMKDALNYSGNVLQLAQIAAAPMMEPGEEGPHPAGQLKMDIRRVVQVKPDEGTGTVSVGPSGHSFYGSFAEFGTSHQPARPWMVPAFEESAEEAVEMFAKVLAAHLEEVLGEQ